MRGRIAIVPSLLQGAAQTATVLLASNAIVRCGAVRVSGTPVSSVDQLRAIETRLAADPGNAALQYDRARALDDLGLVEPALHAYRALIETDPDDFRALTNLGTLFMEQGTLEGAAACFYGALRTGDDDPLAHLNVATVNARAGYDDDARRYFEAVLERFPGDAQACLHAHHGLAAICDRLGEPLRAQQHRARAFARPISWTLAATTGDAALRVLVLSSPHGGDIISNQFFDERTTERIVIVPESYRAGDALPPHDVIFNGIADPDRARATLERAVELVARSAARAINDPRAVLRTDREQTMQRLSHLREVVLPQTRRYPRAAIDARRLAADGFAFPLLLRSPGFHAGDHFERVDEPAELPRVLAQLPGAELYAIAFADARDAAGRVRKYRVVFVDGRPFPVHLAIGERWKIHYFSADMAHSETLRAEEARFLNDLEAALGRSVTATLREIAAVLGLDYAGVDFGIDRSGRMILFEANAAMAIYPPPLDARWEYRRAAHARAIAALRALIVERATPQ